MGHRHFPSPNPILALFPSISVDCDDTGILLRHVYLFKYTNFVVRQVAAAGLEGQLPPNSFCPRLHPSYTWWYEHIYCISKYCCVNSLKRDDFFFKSLSLIHCLTGDLRS